MCGDIKYSAKDSPRPHCEDGCNQGVGTASCKVDRDTSRLESLYFAVVHLVSLLPLLLPLPLPLLLLLLLPLLLPIPLLLPLLLNTCFSRLVFYEFALVRQSVCHSVRPEFFSELDH